MKLFSKKQSTSISTSQECNHKWIDFPAFIRENHNTYDNTYTIQVIEPYVCIYCKQRKNETIWYEEGKCYDVINKINSIKKELSKHNFIKPSIVVEDMVKDFQNVDRDYLAWYDYLHNQGKRPDIKLKL